MKNRLPSIALQSAWTDAGGLMGGSPLINSAILAGEFPIGYTGGGAVIASHLSGSDLIAIASPLPVLTIDGWSRPEIKSIADLRGKRVGVTRFGASSYFSALSMLEAGGVKPHGTSQKSVLVSAKARCATVLGSVEL